MAPPSLASVQNDFEALQITIDALNRTVEKMKNRSLYAEENVRYMQIQMQQFEEEKPPSEEETNAQLVRDLESIIFSLIASLKTFQLDAKSLIFNMHTKIITMDKELNNMHGRLKQTKTKLDHSRHNLSEYKRITELKLLSMHCKYTNTIEEAMEKLKDKAKEEHLVSEQVLADMDQRLMETMLGATYSQSVDSFIPKGNETE